MDNTAFQGDEPRANGHAGEKKNAKNGGQADEEDPWKVTSLKQDFVPWDELNGDDRLMRVLGYMLKVVLVLGFLYLFICSLDFLSSAFRLLGGEAAGRVFQQNDIMSNPVAGLMMGVLVTVLVQSSSTSTSIIVSMVGADLLDIKTAIPIVMGANIGTSVTNTIVAIGQINDKGEFRRAFAGATVHDMFNWLTVIILLPLEVASDFLFRLSDAIMDTLPLETNDGGDKEILKVITKPFTDKIIQVNKKAITNIAKSSTIKYDYDSSVLKICCDKPTRDKCCNTAYDHLDKLKYVDYTDAQKLEFCSTIGRSDPDSCAYNAASAAANQACLSTPWVMKTVKDKGDFVKSLDCSKMAAFQNNDAGLLCCQDAVKNFIAGAPGDARNWTVGCQEISTSCLSAPATSDFISTCLESTQDITKREQFDCFKWTTEVINDTCEDTCNFLFRDLHPSLGDKEIGAILLVISLALLCICLVAIVKLLHSVLQGPMAKMIKKFVNADFPGVFGYLTGYLAILIGAGLTFVVQSSSIFTSTLTPLVGIGVIELERMYPLTLGSNIGTTTTAILSALASDADHLRDTLQVAFCHLFFNITGILIFFPLAFMRFPIPLAKFLGNKTAEYRWFAIVYILLMFFAFPAIIFALSIPGWYVLAGVAGPFVLIAIFVVIVKILQAKKPEILPTKLQDWKFLPKFMRSLEPYDKIMQKIFFCSRFQMKDETNEELDGTSVEMDSNGIDNKAHTANGHGHQSLDNTKL